MRLRNEECTREARPSHDFDQGRALRKNGSDHAAGNLMPVEKFKRRALARFFHGDEKAAGSLGIVEQISEMLGDIFREHRATLDELPIILQAARKKSRLRGCDGP